MRAMILFALGSSLTVAAACSSSSAETECFCTVDDASIPNDAAVGDENPGYNQDAGQPPSSYSPLRLDNDLCLPNALPDDAGFVDCRIVLFFPGSASCDFGLGGPPESDTTYLTDYAAANGAPLPPGTFCELAQTPEDSCLADAGDLPGWCYVHGGCEADAGCAQALCASRGYSPEAGTYTWLVCP